MPTDTVSSKMEGNLNLIGEAGQCRLNNERTKLSPMSTLAMRCGGQLAPEKAHAHVGNCLWIAHGWCDGRFYDIEKTCIKRWMNCQVNFWTTYLNLKLLIQLLKMSRSIYLPRLIRHCETTGRNCCELKLVIRQHALIVLVSPNKINERGHQERQLQLFLVALIFI